MKLIMILALITLCAACWAASSPAIIPDAAMPKYLAVFAETPIVEDGMLDEPVWQQATWSRDFAWIDTGQPLNMQTRFKCVYGRDKISFGLTMEVPAGDPVPINPDFPRAIEVFLDPEGRGRDYMEWAADPAGAQHSDIWRKRVSIARWNSELRIGTRLGVNTTPGRAGYDLVTFELSIPWSELGRVHKLAGRMPKRGDTWRMNFSRVDMNEHLGDYTWSIPVMYYLHAPNTFGWLVFAGDKQPLTSLDQVKFHRLQDDAELIKDNKHFKLLYRDFFINNMVSLGPDRGLLVAPKSYVSRIDSQGKLLWTVTPNDGLARFNRTFVVTDKGYYIGGDRLNDGVAFVDNNGNLKRLSEPDGIMLKARINVTRLDSDRIFFAAGKKYQLMVRGVLREVVECGDTIKDVAAADDKVAIGTLSALEVRGMDGELVSRIPVVGGISRLVKHGKDAVGISGNLGMFRFKADGSWQHYPQPMRIAFHRIFVDSKDRVWAAFVGGFMVVDGDKLTMHAEPAGMDGFNTLTMAEAADGSIVFNCNVPIGTYYTSGHDTAFLLIYKNGKWKKIGYDEGLIAYPTPLVRHGDKLLVGTSAGVYELINY